MHLSVDSIFERRGSTTLPTLVVAIVIGLYWWRVLRMAYKMRRKTGRAANFVPTEKVGRLLRIVWHPVVWIWIAVPWWAALGRPSPWLVQPLSISPELRWVATGVVVTAYLLTRVCWKRMGRSWRMGINPSETTALIFNGPFAYVRHPIYALSSVLMIATAVAVPTPLLIAAAATHLALLQWEARREERYLLELHGNAYGDYRRRVGRFIPRSFRPAGESAAAS